MINNEKQKTSTYLHNLDSFLPYLILLGDATLCLLILNYIPYTEIDWTTYMEQISIFRDGERNYMNIKGSTGPCVYPAGYLYLYSLFQWILSPSNSTSSSSISVNDQDESYASNNMIYKAQILFTILYLWNSFIVLSIYKIVSKRLFKIRYSSTSKVKKQGEEMETNTYHDTLDMKSQTYILTFWRLCMILTCLSKRIHSIFILRLFNDGPTMLILYSSLYFFLQNKWNIGCVLYSISVSIKMNTLLYAPGLLLLLLQYCQWDISLVACKLIICALVQILIGFPFLKSFPIAYLRKAFELDRVFMLKWTVNWKFLPEMIFTSKTLSLTLLVLHISTLVLLYVKWYRSSHRQHKRHNYESTNGVAPKYSPLTPEYTAYTLFVSNFVGVVFARTLHYQFYVWYFHTIPFILAIITTMTTSKNTISIPFRLWNITETLVIFCAIEYAFNIYPSTPCSSGILQLTHYYILWLIWSADVPSHVDFSKPE